MDSSDPDDSSDSREPDNSRKWLGPALVVGLVSGLALGANHLIWGTRTEPVPPTEQEIARKAKAEEYRELCHELYDLSLHSGHEGRNLVELCVQREFHHAVLLERIRQTEIPKNTAE